MSKYHGIGSLYDLLGDKIQHHLHQSYLLIPGIVFKASNQGPDMGGGLCSCGTATVSPSIDIEVTVLVQDELLDIRANPSSFT